ncbi:MAG TPA: addiction module antidote protein, HigA family [Propionibacteriaceae bacterium]|nr:addiction module antidote protein, HigA family [Propionibacteriaceae bacterium]
MATNERYEYAPDYAVHPGEILGERLAAYGMSQTELARRIGMSTKTLSQIVNGKAPVTPETAIQLERVLGVSARLWTGLDASYRLLEARTVAAQQLVAHGEWARGFPYAELVRRGVVESTRDISERASELLEFFGVGSVDAWHAEYGSLQVAFRRSPAFNPSPEATACWLRLAELQAMDTECAPFDERAFMSCLRDARSISRGLLASCDVALRERCATAGVALVFVPELRGTHVSGAARWLNPAKAMMALSLRHKTDDHFWFSLFHEAGHLLRDSKKAVYLDSGDEGFSCVDEEQANRFACDFLIPPDAYRRFVVRHCFSELSVCRFSDEIGVTAGIVVGRLQHDRHLPYNSALNHLKRTVEFAEA